MAWFRALPSRVVELSAVRQNDRQSEVQRDVLEHADVGAREQPAGGLFVFRHVERARREAAPSEAGLGDARLATHLGATPGLLEA